MKKASHRTEAGPIKSAIQTIGGVTCVIGIVGAFSSDVVVGLAVAAIGGGVAWLGSKLPDRNHVTW